MPAKKRPAARKQAGRKQTGTPKKAGRSKSGFSCPDCDFVAKHAMGLGRHRSARHGVVSKRQSRRQAGGSWLTRQEAARRAGVHYNTVRQWEQAGLLRRARRPGIRGALINADDLTRVLMDRASSGGRPAPVADTAAVVALERQYKELVVGLEQLLATAKASAPAKAGRAGARRGPKPGRKRGRPSGKTTARTAVARKPARRRSAARTQRAKTAAMRRSGARPAPARGRPRTKRRARR